MKEIPLFPLNTVLFPNMPITLHIFEERYKQMMNQCIANSSPFGVVMIRQGSEVGRTAETYQVGCAAHIAQVQPLEDGRMNMVALGKERFRIESLHHDLPYLRGEIVEIELDTTMKGDIGRITDLLRAAITEYLTVLSSVGDVEFKVDKLPDSPLELAYLSATLLQAPNERKQELLEINGADQLIREVYDTCRREISILRAMLSSEQMPDNDGPFSLN